MLRKRTNNHYATHAGEINARHAEKGYAKQPKYRFGIYKRNASVRGHEWCLSFEEFLSFWKGTCFYCGDPIETIGLDRLDNSLGYTKENVVPCCSKCNIAKHKMDLKEFVEHVRKIAKHLKDFAK